MGIATIRISTESIADVVGMFKHMGVNIVGSRDASNEYRCILLDVEGECVPDAEMVTAIIHTERTPEAHSLKLTFEIDLAYTWKSRPDERRAAGHNWIV